MLETVLTTASGSVRLTESVNGTPAGRLPWLQPNPNGYIFHVGPVLVLFRPP